MEPGVDHDAARRTVMAAVRDLDGATVRDALLQTLLVSGVDATVAEVVMPVLRDVGDGWERGDLGVLHEHFVSSSFRGVLGELRMPVQGEQVRTVVLACPPRELHDLPLELFGAMLHARWWRVVSLGANTPMTAVADAVRYLDADACVIAGVRRSAFESRVAALSRLGSGCRCSSPVRGPSPCRPRPRGPPCCRATCGPRPTWSTPSPRGRSTPTPPTATSPRSADPAYGGSCGSPTSDTPASSSRWPTPGCSSTRAPSPTT